MSNESIFLITAFLDLAFVLLMFRLGKGGLTTSVAVNVILVSVFGAKLVPIFGLVTNSGNVFYASIFLAVNMLVEHYGKNEGVKAVWIGFASLVLFMIMSQFVLSSTPSGDTAAASEAIDTLFRIAPRIAFASMFAYIVAQHINIWLYDFLRKQARALVWYRNIVSAGIAQFFDSIIFFWLAFYGTIPHDVLLQTMVAGFTLKSIVAVVSTPFLYASFAVNQSQDKSFPANHRAHRAIDLKKTSRAKMIALIVIASGFLAAGGWLFNIPVLTTLIPGTISMKFSTAVSFLLTGLILYFIAKSVENKKDIGSVVLPIAILGIALLVLPLFVSMLFGTQTGIENMFAQESPTAAATYFPGRPSVATMVNFMLIAAAGLFTLWNQKQLFLQLEILGAVIGMTGLVALLGYALDQPVLYFSVPGFSNGMAVNTAVLFVLLGYGLLQLREHL